MHLTTIEARPTHFQRCWSVNSEASQDNDLMAWVRSIQQSISPRNSGAASEAKIVRWSSKARRKAFDPPMWPLLLLISNRARQSRACRAQFERARGTTAGGRRSAEEGTKFAAGRTSEARKQQGACGGASAVVRLSSHQPSRIRRSPTQLHAQKERERQRELAVECHRT
jgi:hypothetical protein